jgi:putative acetyltransferase
MMPRPANVTVRRAQVGDAEAIHATFALPHAMSGTLQVPYPSLDVWRKRLADMASDDFILVAEVAGEVVGNLGLHPASRSPRRRHAALIGMSVRDDWQNRGVGTALLAAAVDLAENWLNYTRLELTVYTDNAAALKLYRRFGFALEGTLRAFAFRDGRFIDAHTMARLSPRLHAERAGDGAKTAAKAVPGPRRKRPS